MADHTVLDTETQVDNIQIIPLLYIAGSLFFTAGSVCMLLGVK